MQSKHTLTLSGRAQADLRRKLGSWFRAQARDLPWRRTRDPYAIMVSEFMLQQTLVATVLDYYRRWMERFPDFRALAAATEDEVLHAWQGLGYYSRARNLHRAAHEVVNEHNGALPDHLPTIAGLPGIGRYTAGAIASFSFDRATPIIDANIARVLARLLDLREPIDSARGTDLLWRAAGELLPRRAGREHNSALMELGALICLPRKPRCAICPIRSYCKASDPESLPIKNPRPPTVSLSEDCAWIVEDGSLLLEQQTGRRWRGLWKLPRALSLPAAGPPLVELQYPFTHHRVTMRVYTGVKPETLGASHQWFPISALDSAALPSPHRRAIEHILKGPLPARRALPGHAAGQDTTLHAGGVQAFRDVIADRGVMQRVPTGEDIHGREGVLRPGVDGDV